MKHLNLKRLAAMLFAVCLLLSFTACAAQEKSGKADPASTPSGAASRPDALNGEGSEKPAPVAPDPGDASPADGDHYYSGDSSVSFYARGDSDSPAEPHPAEGSPAHGTAELSEGGEGRPDSGEPIELDDPVAPVEPSGADDPVAPEPPSSDPGEALKLTAAEWNDNENWPFFTNLVNAGTISFPSFGIDPRHRIEVRVTTPAGTAPAGETVSLLDAENTVLWTARTDKNGVAYLFWAEGQMPDRIVCGEASAPVRVQEGGDAQNPGTLRPLETVNLETAPAAPAQTGLQVMFIVDTTGSMSDEIAYLQKDFSAIAGRAGGDDVRWAVSFYRDEGDDYVTRHSEFSSDVAAVQKKINAEYADGGGDTPEAVAQVLTECLTERSDWEESCAKLAFLIFDAPPHTGKEAELQAAVRAAAEKGIRLIPVVASNAERDTELFGRALAIMTNGSYVFLTDDSGVGESHLEPIVGDYQVELLQDLIVKIIERYR